MPELKLTPGRSSQEPPPARFDVKDLRGRTAVIVLTAASLLALLYVLWVGRVVFLLVFAGLLLAVLLRTAAAWLEMHLRVGRRWSLVVVVAAIAGVLTLGIWLRGPAIGAQIDQLQDRLPVAAASVAAQLRTQEWGRWLLAHGLRGEQLPRAADWLPRVTGVLSTTLGFLAGIVIVLFLGVTIAAEPETYRRGVQRLFPAAAQPGVSTVMDKLELALRWWLAARLISMCAVGIMVFLGLWALHVPLAGTLGVLAALLAFIPNIGPFLSAIPPVLLAFSISPQRAVFVVLLFWAVHAVEGLLLTPIAERTAVHLPPALTFSVQMLLAVLVGPLGIALAAPLTTVAMVLVRSVYIPKVLNE